MQSLCRDLVIHLRAQKYIGPEKRLLPLLSDKANATTDTMQQNCIIQKLSVDPFHPTGNGG